METAIQVIWWIGLIGALLMTLVILKQVSLVLRSLRHVLTLANYTREAAAGIAANVEPLTGLDALKDPTSEFREATDALSESILRLGGIFRRLK